MEHNPKSYRKRTLGGRELAPETLMMSYGYDPLMSEGAIKPPIFQSSTFVFRTAEDGKQFFRQMAGGMADPGLIYSRFNNPDLQIAEDRLALWDDAEASLVFSSGMAAISTALLTFLSPGDGMIYSAPIYGGTESFIRVTLPRFGVHFEAFDAGIDSAGMRGAARKLTRQIGKNGKIRVILLETPANPTNGLVDIRAAADLAEKIAETQGEKPLLLIDNTFLGPLWQKPLRLGADIALYSLTKYVGGHSDLIAGAASGRAELIRRMRPMRNNLGGMGAAETSWLILRSLETLKLRMEASAANARKVAEYLKAHPKIARVHYLGFATGRVEKKLVASQCQSAGSTFAFDVVGGEAEAFRFLDALQIIKLAVSLGGTETLICHPASTTHSGLGVERCNRIGVTEALVRISVGVENPADLIADLGQALAGI